MNFLQFFKVWKELLQPGMDFSVKFREISVRFTVRMMA
jgi:hypothetical protein